MLLLPPTAALVNVVLLVVAGCLLYFLMKRRRQLQAARSGSTDTEIGVNSMDAVPPAATYVTVTSLAHSTQSLGSLNSTDIPPNLCPTPSRTPFGGMNKPTVGLNETFESSMSSLECSLGLEGFANLNTKLETLRCQRNQICFNQTCSSSASSFGLNNEDIANQNDQLESKRNQSCKSERDEDSGYDSGISSNALGKALDEVLAKHNRLESLKAQQKSRRNRTAFLSLPQTNQTSKINASSTGMVLKPACLSMDF